MIQEANIRALGAGMTTDGVFDIVRRVREKSRIPLVFLTYLNPVFHYGYDRFFEKCGELSVDGIIIPDLPFKGGAGACGNSTWRGSDFHDCTYL